MNKIEEIVVKLLELSEDGKITWKPTANEETFAAVLGNTSALISKIGGSTRKNYLLRILNQTGTEIGRYSSAQEDLRALHVTARRSALNIDAELDGLLVELNQF